MNTQQTMEKARKKFTNSPTIKIITIGILVLVLLIPAAMTSSLLKERKMRKNRAVAEISQKWGNEQTMTGPFITVPYKVFHKNNHEKIQYTIKYFHFLPDKLQIKGSLSPDIRYRSIYKAILYNARMQLSGTFTVPTPNQLNIEGDILWDKAMFSMGISDLRGIRENILLTFGKDSHEMNPGLATTDIAPEGVSCPVSISPADLSKPFSFKLHLAGSQQIAFTPMAKETKVTMQSTWPSPSFNGAFLPEKRHISETGFDAQWKVLHLNRNYPQYWQGDQYKVGKSCFGLKLLLTADVYQKSIRVSKYAVMFIVFTFAAFFFSEIINKKKIHPIQYLMVGLAVILFYTLLLSISEHIPFDYAYILSAGAITLLITGYAKAICKSNPFTITVFSILFILYGYLYIILQLEDYALLMGSTGLFIVLATVMYITRKIDWYELEME